MAEDNGGSGGFGWPFDIFKAAQDAVGDVVTEFQSFTEFQRRVDQLIRDLKGSSAGPEKVGAQALVRQQFGGGGGAWVEAAGLHTAYDSVITQLESLSKLLADSIEGMGIAVLASHKGYANIDADVRDRMAAISAETTEHYGGHYDPEKSKQWKGDETPGTEDAPKKDPDKTADGNGSYASGGI